jgi:hypothetical protein
VRVWMIWWLYAAERVREMHVYFDEEVCKVHESVVGDVRCGADDEDTLVGCWEVHEEPQALEMVSVCLQQW